MERYDDKVLPAAIKRKLDDTEFSPSKMDQIEELTAKVNNLLLI